MYNIYHASRILSRSNELRLFHVAIIYQKFINGTQRELKDIESINSSKVTRETHQLFYIQDLVRCIVGTRSVFHRFRTILNTAAPITLMKFSRVLTHLFSIINHNFVSRSKKSNEYKREIDRGIGAILFLF